MSIKSWPKTERPREKLLNEGEKSLSNAELLAIFLQTGIKGKSALELARDLLNHFKRLDKIFECDLKSFQKIKGMGFSKFILLKAALELSRRYYFYSIKTVSLENTAATKQFLITKLNKRKQEVFACLFLDNKNQLIAYEELFFGSIDRADIYPREIIKAALKQNASSIILAHNHTSGDPNPSFHDITLTKQLKSLLAIIDIIVLDHIIIGHHHVYSFSEKDVL